MNLYELNSQESNSEIEIEEAESTHGHNNKILQAICNACFRLGWKELDYEIQNRIDQVKYLIRRKYPKGQDAHIFELTIDSRGYEIKFHGHWTRARVHYMQKKTDDRFRFRKPRMIHTKWKRPKVRKFVAHCIAQEKRRGRELDCQDVIDS